MKRTPDRLTAPMPVAPGEKGERDDKMAPAGTPAPAGGLDDLIGKKVQEIDAKSPPSDGAK